jgi:archaeosortase B (VPXXXP-CTERM-specific)
MRLSPGLRFGAGFFGYLLLFSIGFWALSVQRHLGPLQHLMAVVSARVGRWTGGHAIAAGNTIVVPTLTMDVNHECTGVFVCMLFAGFVLAYPVSWRSRLIGLAAGIPLFLIVNVLRLATLARIAEIYPRAFFYVHEYVWQGILTALVLIGAIAWAERAG